MTGYFDKQISPSHCFLKYHHAVFKNVFVYINPHKYAHLTLNVWTQQFGEWHPKILTPLLRAITSFSKFSHQTVAAQVRPKTSDAGGDAVWFFVTKELLKLLWAHVAYIFAPLHNRGAVFANANSRKVLAPTKMQLLLGMLPRSQPNVKSLHFRRYLKLCFSQFTCAHKKQSFPKFTLLPEFLERIVFRGEIAVCV